MLTACGKNSATAKNTRTVVDMTRTKVKIPKQVKRVADLWHANNQIVLLLGGQQKLVTTTPMIQKQGWFRKVDPQIAKVKAPFVGQDLQIEEILKTKPDVAIAANPGQVKQLRQAKIPTVNAMFTDFPGLKKSVNLTAKILGKKYQTVAKRYNQELAHNLSYVQKRVANQKRVRVLHITDATNLKQVDGQETIINEWIKFAGGKNAIKARGNMVQVNPEEIVKQNPQVIIIGQTTTANARRLVKHDPLLQKTTAAEEGKVYGNPQGTFPWDRYSTEEALQVLWAAKLLHPAQFTQLDMVEKTRDFYQKYYHYRLTKQQAKQILAGYVPKK
nr:MULTISPECIES: ABC transporter substrate-binding protein [Lactobacillus]